MKKILKSSKAAIDLASIMVGIIVAGVIGAVISAVIFVVIPWAQDEAAKRQVEAITVAQKTYAGLIADPNNSSLHLGRFLPQQVVPAEEGKAKFATLKELADAGLINLKASETDPTKTLDGKICTSATETAAVFEISVLSETGKVFYADAKTGMPKQAKKGTVTCLGTIDEDGKLGEVIPPPLQGVCNADGSLNASYKADEPWVVPDAGLVTAIRNSLAVAGKPVSSTYKLVLEDACILKELNGNMMNIVSLEGLEKAGELSWIRLQNNKLTNVDALAGRKVVSGGIYLAGNTISNINGLSSLETTGNLDLSGNKITDLTPLSNLKSVTGNLYLTNNLFTTVQGFDALTTVGALQINSNSALTSISGFNSLPAATSVDVRMNGNLETVEGFTNLKTVKAQVQFFYNVKLKTINALNNLEEVGLLIYNSNNAVTSVNSFEKLRKVTGNIEFLVGSATTPTAFNAPLLETVTGYVYIGTGTKNITLPKLVSVGSYLRLNSVNTVDLAALQTVGGYVDIVPTSGSTVNLPVIETVNGDLKATSLTAASLAKLRSVNGNMVDMSTYNAPNRFASLETVSGNFSVVGNSATVNLGKLTKVGGTFTFLMAGPVTDVVLPAQTEIGGFVSQVGSGMKNYDDFAGLRYSSAAQKVEFRLVSGTYIENLEGLRGLINSKANYSTVSVTLPSDSYAPSTTNLDLSVFGNFTTADSFNMKVSANRVSNLAGGVNNLTTVAGAFTFDYSANSTTAPAGTEMFSKLSKVGGTFTAKIFHADVKANADWFPLLDVTV